MPCRTASAEMRTLPTVRARLSSKAVTSSSKPRMLSAATLQASTATSRDQNGSRTRLAVSRMTIHTATRWMTILISGTGQPRRAAASIARPCRTAGRSAGSGRAEHMRPASSADPTAGRWRPGPATTAAAAPEPGQEEGRRHRDDLTQRGRRQNVRLDPRLHRCEGGQQPIRTGSRRREDPPACASDQRGRAGAGAAASGLRGG